MKKEIGNDQIIKMIERQQVISYKKKPQYHNHINHINHNNNNNNINININVKPSYKVSKEQQEDFQSAQSLKSNVFSQQSAKFNKKNTPLPQLTKQRRKIFGRGLAYNQNKVTPVFQQKQVRQHDNLVLKQQNNHLSTENMKLKTKLMTLEKQNIRLQKQLQQDSQKIKTPGSNNVISGKDPRFLKLNPQSSSLSSMKIVVRNLKKQLQEVKKQNTKIKWSIKFTRINELQCQRDNILEETQRLRAIIQQELGKRANFKIKQHGMSTLQNRLTALQQKNVFLIRENTQLQNKLKKLDQNNKKNQKISQNEKNLNKMLFNARRVIKEKQKQLEDLKSQQNSSNNAQSLNSIPGSQKNAELNVAQSSKDTGLPHSRKQFSNKRLNSKQKRVMSKSAQKYRANINKSGDQCQNCKRLSDQNNVLLRRIQQLSQQVKNEKQRNSKKGFGQLSKGPVDKPNADAIETVGRFLTYRFKAHHLSLQQAEKYLVSNELSTNNQTQMTVSQIVQSLVAQPFSIISSAYLQATITGIFYEKQTGKQITFDQNKKMNKDDIIKQFRKIIKSYQLMSQTKQQQMFIQIAELVTNYHQHILTALNGKRNGQGTISELDLTFFFNQIQLQKEYVDFIITQIILESYDLIHLNYYAMFQIFYMPTQQIQGGVSGQGQPPSKKKFQVDQVNVVKQEDQQYQQSRSYVDAKQKTQSKRDQDEYDEQQEHQIIKKKTHSISSRNSNTNHNTHQKLNSSNIQNKIQQQQNNQIEQIDMKNGSSSIISQNNGNTSNYKSKNKSKIQQNLQQYQQQFDDQKVQIVGQQEQNKNEKYKDKDKDKSFVLEQQVQDYKQQFQE